MTDRQALLGFKAHNAIVRLQRDRSSATAVYGVDQ
jgi:hypothetical protein